MASSSKNIQKTLKCSKRSQKKREILFHRFVGKYALFLPLITFFEERRGGENSAKLGRKKERRRGGGGTSF